MKKLLAILLSVLMLCTAIPFATVAAAEEPTIWVSTIGASAGDTIEVQVKLLNNPGVIAAMVEIEYDHDVMELVTYYDEDADDTFNMIESATGWKASCCFFGALGRCVMGFSNGTASKNVTKELFYTATFKIKEDAPHGTYPLTVVYDPANFFNVDGEDVAFTGVNGSVTVCEHEWNDATCTEPATCVLCGAQNGESLGHTFGAGVETLAPTCTTDGEMTYTCSVCKESYTEAIAAGHTFGAGVETLAPTCTTDGEMTYTCSVCKESYTEAIAAGHPVAWEGGPCPVCGEVVPAIAVSTLVAGVGDTIEVQVKLLNNPGVIAAMVEIEYDHDVMELVTYYDEDADDTFNMIESATGWKASCCFFGALGGCVMGFSNGTASKNVTKELFYTATFKIKEDAPHGTYPLTVVYDPANFFNVDGEDVAFTGVNGSVTVLSCVHEYDNVCDAECNRCGEIRADVHRILQVAAVAPTCYATGNIAYWCCEACGQAWLNAACTLPINPKAVVLPMIDHTYDNAYDVNCNVCGNVRADALPCPIGFGGNSISEDVNGLAFRFDVEMEGMAVTGGTTAVYDNATVGAYKVVSMGAVLSNNGSNLKLGNVDGVNVIDIAVNHLCECTATSASFAVRVINIPDANLDTVISARPYLIVEDADGRRSVVYGEIQSATYNEHL